MGRIHNIYTSLLVNSNKDYSFKKWIGIILFVKLGLFIFYNICFHIYPEVSVENGLLYVKGGDTFTYYPPLINLLKGDGYGNACRMPGLALPFVPFYIITQNEELSFNLVIVFQFIVSTISVYVLGLIANKVFDNNHRIFLITILLYSFWYHIADHILMADSISISSLIFASYFFIVSADENFNDRKHVVYSGFFFTWSIFSRLIAIVPFMILCILIFYWLIVKQKKAIKFLSTILLFTSCFVICESVWILRNKISLNRNIIFAVPECYSSYGYNWIELTNIPIAWGLETTPWEGEIDWWLDKKSTAKQFQFHENVFTKSFNADSLTALKNWYWLLRDTEPFTLNQNYANKVALYLQEYKNENTLKYYVLNPLKLFLKFHHKKRIEGIPFPALNKMNLFQKIFKAINWIFILTISVLFLVSPLLLFFKRNKASLCFILIPFSISIFLAVLGAIEQRYFWPIIPFCIVFFAFVVDNILGIKNKLRTRKNH